MAGKVTPTRHYKPLQHTVVVFDPDFKEQPKTDNIDIISTSATAAVETDPVSVPLSTTATEEAPIMISPTKKRDRSNKPQSQLVPIPEKSNWPSKLVLDAFIAKPDNSEFDL